MIKDHHFYKTGNTKMAKMTLDLEKLIKHIEKLDRMGLKAHRDAFKQLLMDAQLESHGLPK